MKVAIIEKLLIGVFPRKLVLFSNPYPFSMLVMVLSGSRAENKHRVLPQYTHKGVLWYCYGRLKKNKTVDICACTNSN